MAFIVVDTEGTNLLREIAVLDEQGTLLYEAVTREHPSNANARFRVEPLQQILQRFATLAQNQRVICHFAEHDQRVLQSSFQRMGLPWPNIEFECTWELAKQYFPGLPGYSLDYLSRYLTLRVHQRHFNSRAAHSARYDAEFTHQLYLKIMDAQTRQFLQDQPNPFISSRVDTPFQQHPDFQPIYQDEFSLLKSGITEIQRDRNHQSRGAVVIGEPGSGKTHLMMRLAQELLQVNRLLFIRQPNNPDAVIYHIYTRILESFVEQVPANGFTQLENLLAHSFVNIISAAQRPNLTQRGRDILSLVQDDPLNLYRRLGAEGTAARRAYWQRIEGRVSTWWMDQYGTAGFAPQIIRGIIKFCSYSEPQRRAIVSRWLAAQQLETEECEQIGLPNWNEEISREEFSLQAITVFSRLSLLDEPLIIVFDQLEGLIHNDRLLRQFGFAVTELFTHVPNSLVIFNLFPDRWQHFQTFFDGAFLGRASQYQIVLNRLTNEQILGVLKVKLESVQPNLELETVFTTEQLNDILSCSSIRAILNRAAEYYRQIIHHPIPSSASAPSSAGADTRNDENILTIEQRLLRVEQSLSKITHVFDVIATALTSIDFHDFLNKTEITSGSHPVTSDNHNAQQEIFTEQPAIREYLNEQRAALEETYHQPQIITDNDDLGKLLTIAGAFQGISHFDVDQLHLGRQVLPEHLVIDQENQRYAIGFLGVGGTAFTNRIRNYNELVLHHSNTQFYLFRDMRHGEITGAVGRQHIDSLNNSPNGRFVWMDQRDRVTFDLIYRLISDVENREVEFSLSNALQALISDYSNYWLIQILATSHQ